MVLNVAKSPTS